MNRIVLEAEVASVNVWHAWQVVIVFEGHAELFLEVHALPKLVGGLAVDGKGEGLVVGLRRDGVLAQDEVTVLGLVLVLLAALMTPAALLEEVDTVVELLWLCNRRALLLGLSMVRRWMV